MSKEIRPVGTLYHALVPFSSLPSAMREGRGDHAKGPGPSGPASRIPVLQVLVKARPPEDHQEVQNTYTVINSVTDTYK